MPITSEDVARVAHLARLRIPEDSLAEVTDRFTRVLSMIDELQKINTDGVDPMSNPHDMVQRLRADEITENDERDALQRVAPEVVDGYFLVPRVID